MVELLLDKKYEVVAYGRSEESVKMIAKRGAKQTGSLKELVSALVQPRLIWIMVPHQVVDLTLSELPRSKLRGIVT